MVSGFAKEVEILLEIAGRVTHCVCILAHDVGTCHILACRLFLHIAYRRIHRADDIRVPCLVSLFELHGARLVALLDPPVGNLEVLSVARLVAETPG